MPSPESNICCTDLISTRWLPKLQASDLTRKGQDARGEEDCLTSRFLKWGYESRGADYISSTEPQESVQASYGPLSELGKHKERGDGWVLGAPVNGGQQLRPSSLTAEPGNLVYLILIFKKDFCIMLTLGAFNNLQHVRHRLWFHIRKSLSLTRKKDASSFSKIRIMQFIMLFFFWSWLPGSSEQNHVLKSHHQIVSGFLNFVPPFYFLILFFPPTNTFFCVSCWQRLQKYLESDSDEISK